MDNRCSAESQRSAFYPLSQFPKLQVLVDNWTVIRDEYLKLSTHVMNVDRESKSHDQVYEEVITLLRNGGEYGWLKGWGEEGRNGAWIQYGIMVSDVFAPSVRETMPKTTNILEQLKGIRACALNILKGNTLLECHRHPELFEQGLLQLHIGLEAAEQSYAYLNVNGEFFQHLPGSAAIFDGSLDHFAFNASLTPRTIFYMEFYKNQFMDGS